MSPNEARPRPSSALKDPGAGHSRGRLLVLFGPSEAGKQEIVRAAGLCGFVPLTRLELGKDRPSGLSDPDGLVADRRTSTRSPVAAVPGIQAGWATQDNVGPLAYADFVVSTCDFVLARLAARRLRGRLVLVHHGSLDEAELRRELQSRNTRETEIETRVLNAREFHERLGLLRMVADAEIVNDGPPEDLPEKLQMVIHALWPPVTATATD